MFKLIPLLFASLAMAAPIKVADTSVGMSSTTTTLSSTISTTSSTTIASDCYQLCKGDGIGLAFLNCMKNCEFPPSTTTTTTTTTSTYVIGSTITFQPGYATVTVPSGVSRATVTVAGAAGQSGSCNIPEGAQLDATYGSGQGGNGTVIQVNLGVSPGQVLYMMIGSMDGTQGYGLGGQGSQGGGNGGGSSAVSLTANFSFLYAVSGGGGGGASCNPWNGNTVVGGGDGGGLYAIAQLNNPEAEFNSVNAPQTYDGFYGYNDNENGAGVGGGDELSNNMTPNGRRAYPTQNTMVGGAGGGGGGLLGGNPGSVNYNSSLPIAFSTGGGGGSSILPNGISGTAYYASNPGEGYAMVNFS